MATNRFLATLNIQPVILPQDTTPAATSDWVSLENYASVIFSILLDDGSATSDDLKLNVRQATDNAGGSAKNVDSRTWRVKTAGGDVDASGAYVDNVGTDYDHPGENTAAIQVETGADELDVAGGFKFVAIQHDTGTSSKIISASAILCGPRYAVAPDQWPAVDA